MAVRRRARDIKSGERSVRTGATLDDDAFIECDAEWLGDHAANRIAGAAGSEYGNEGDWLARIVVGEQRRTEECRPCGQENEKHPSHAMLLPGCRVFSSHILPPRLTPITLSSNTPLNPP